MQIRPGHRHSGLPAAPRRTSARVAVTGAAAAAVLVAGVSVAVAGGGFTDATGRINACVDKNLGTVRLLQAGSACLATEQPLSWNQQGPVGPVGPAGAPGGAGQALVSYEDAGTYTAPTNRVLLSGNPPIVLTSAPSFTTSAAGFVHILGHSRMRSSDPNGGYGSCDGGGGNGPMSFVAVDGQSTAGTNTYLNPDPSYRDRVSEDTFWMPAGTHTLSFQFLPNGCQSSASGTTQIDQLAVTVVAYN